MLVVQDDLLNASALQTVMVIPLTSNVRRAQAIGNVLLAARETRLQKDSVALVCQVVALDKDFFDELASTLSTRTLTKIDRGLELALGL